MKIGKKLLISNVVTIIASMTVLAVIISMIVSNYIKKDIEGSLIKENVMLQKTFEYKKFLYLEDGELKIEDGFYEYGLDSSVMSATFVVDNNDIKLLTRMYLLKNIFSENEIQHILDQKLENSYNINIAGKQFLAYNDKADINFNDKSYSILITTMIPNYQIRTIIIQIIKVLIASIFIIGALSILITGYMGSRITKPIKVLENITHRISNKKYDNQVEISTGDELESLGRSINTMAESIKKHDTEQKKFYENISHELKTPLTVISGYAQGIKTKIFDDSEKALDVIIEESTQLKKQLENIIYLSKLDSVKDFYEFEKTSINNMISLALEKVESIIIINDIDIVYEPGSDFLLNIDKEKFLRMLTNILSNCIKYTKDTIWIESRITEEKYEIQIYDNGEGFCKEILDNPFSRTNIGKKEGSGIGLSIIKKIADAHKGSVYITNHNDGGAVYTLEFPIQ